MDQDLVVRVQEGDQRAFEALATPTIGDLGLYVITPAAVAATE